MDPMMQGMMAWLSANFPQVAAQFAASQGLPPPTGGVTNGTQGRSGMGGPGMGAPGMGPGMGGGPLMGGGMGGLEQFLNPAAPQGPLAGVVAPPPVNVPAPSAPATPGPGRIDVGAGGGLMDMLMGARQMPVNPMSGLSGYFGR